MEEEAEAAAEQQEKARQRQERVQQRQAQQRQASDTAQGRLAAAAKQQQQVQVQQQRQALRRVQRAWTVEERVQLGRAARRQHTAVTEPFPSVSAAAATSYILACTTGHKSLPGSDRPEAGVGAAVAVAVEEGLVVAAASSLLVGAVVGQAAGAAVAAAVQAAAGSVVAGAEDWGRAAVAAGAALQAQQAVVWMRQQERDEQAVAVRRARAAVVGMEQHRDGWHGQELLAMLEAGLWARFEGSLARFKATWAAAQEALEVVGRRLAEAEQALAVVGTEAVAAWRRADEAKLPAVLSGAGKAAGPGAEMHGGGGRRRRGARGAQRMLRAATPQVLGRGGRGLCEAWVLGSA